MRLLSPKQVLFLIQTPYIADYGPMRSAAGTYFPLGLGYIAAHVRQHGHDVRLCDPNVEDHSVMALAAAVEQARPTLVGVSFMTPQFFKARDIIAAIKERCPDVPVAVGGAHPNVAPQKTLEEIPGADYAVFGEGEQTTVELLDLLDRNRGDRRQIAGLCWRDGDRIVVNSARAPLEDLDRLPFPARDIMDQSRYRAQSFLPYSNKAMAIITARGCPSRCVFCASGHGMRMPVRSRTIDNVMAEIDLLRSRYGIEYLLIKDDTFTLRGSRVREFCSAIKARHPGLRWHCMGRVNGAQEDLLAEMKAAGLNDIFFGIESGNDEILRRAGKGIRTAQARAAVETCDRLGIRTYGAFILGLPGDTRETMEQTIDFACSLPLTMAGFSILIPYPGTKAFADHYEPVGDGRIDYAEFVASTGVHCVKGYTGIDGATIAALPGLVAKAQRRFYMRPARILRLLKSATPSMLLGYGRGFAALMRKEIYLIRKGLR